MGALKFGTKPRGPGGFIGVYYLHGNNFDAALVLAPATAVLHGDASRARRVLGTRLLACRLVQHIRAMPRLIN